jgi:hypothetical protein
MEDSVGITLTLFFCAAAAGSGVGRERVFHPAAAIAVASGNADAFRVTTLERPAP